MLLKFSILTFSKIFNYFNSLKHRVNEVNYVSLPQKKLLILSFLVSLILDYLLQVLDSAAIPLPPLHLSPAGKVSVLFSSLHTSSQKNDNIYFLL